MELVTLANVTKDFGHRRVLAGVSLRVNEGQKLGLIGPNGGGKTSILRIITGEEPATGGAITRIRGLRLGYVSQHVEFDDEQTALECVLADHAELERALRAAEARLAAAPAERVDEAATAYAEARDVYERAGGDVLPGRAAAMLDALGLAGRADQRVATLSGGERNILSLTKALLGEPDLLLLDEPDNHLDFAGLGWLEGYLGAFRGAVLIVSHNRYLLDRVVQGVLHLENGRVAEYAGNYSQYRASVLRDKIAQQADYVANQKRLAQLEALVKRFEEFARRTADPAWGKRLRARRSQLARERRQAVEKPIDEASSMRLDVRTEASHADIALQVRGYTKAFGELRLFEDAELDVAAGENVALVGPNGSGKTTLLRDIVEQGAWDHPSIRVGPSMKVGYCAQGQEVLDERRTVFEEILADGTIKRDEAFGVLARFLFTPNDYDKRVGDLSGGERNRLQLAKVLLRRPNFLILDEPTNHLDIPAREAVEEALADFKGTGLIVSHDRYLLDKIVERVVEIRDRRLVAHAGNFTEFWHATQSATRARPARVATRGRARRPRAPRAPARAPEAPPSPLQLRIAEVEDEKLALEREVAAAFSRGDHRAGGRASKQLERTSVQLEALYERWQREEG